jgi:hypothetical protein
MIRMMLVVALLTSLGRNALAATDAAPAVRLRRFALLVGVDDGGPGRVRLRYAATDAQAVARVLESLGGVAPADLVLVSDASRGALEGGFARVEALLRAGRAPGVRRELVVYYSGHSDEEGLLLGRDRMSYVELRARIRDSSADLRVAILDSCESGAFTRKKGGTRRAPFLVDASIDMRGHAFLTSSSANEVAQESDRIAASFFTYYLVSGLRGAADANQDRRVTLQEAFQFAAQETLARTERTQGGPQHAAYEFDLAGTGDMVMTDVRTTQAGLVLARDLAGRISVRVAGGALVAELRKPAGSTIELGLEPGAYVVVMEGEPTATSEARVTLSTGQHAELGPTSFHASAPLEVAVARGDGPPAPTAEAPLRDQATLKLGLLPRGVDATTEVDGLSFGFIADRAARLHGMQLSLGYNQVDENMRGMQLTVGANFVGGNARGSQLAVGANVVAGDARGTQIAVGANVVAGEAHGLQAASGANLARRAAGVQIAAGANIAGELRGAQIGDINYAGGGRGLQLGIVNIADTLTGTRLGVINVARSSRAVEIGLINIAEHADGESIALLSLIGNGIHEVAVYSSDVMLTNLGLKLGGRHLYTELGVGYQPGDDLPAGTAPARFSRTNARWGWGAGFGWRFPIGAGVLEAAELEAFSNSIQPAFQVIDNAPQVASLRMLVNLRFAPHLTLLAGLTGNVAVATHSQDADLGLGLPENVVHSGTTTVRIYPGALLGLQL